MRHPCLTWWPEKFFADTAHIPGDAAAFYGILLGHAWVRGGSLPNDDDQLRLMARCQPKRWPQIKPIILSFFVLEQDGRLHQKRMDQEWQRATRKHQKKQKNSEEQTDQTGKPKAGRSRRHNGKKLNDYYARARSRDPTPTPLNSSLREESLEAPASLSVRSHASPALRLVENTEPPPDDRPPLTDERREQIVRECITALQAAGLKNLDDLDDPAIGTIGELKRRAAEQRLAEIKEEPIVVSPILAASLAQTG